MEAWWEKSNLPVKIEPEKSAVAYYRHSADIGQENSVEIQQDNVLAFAKKHNIQIIQEFADRGKSGLNAEGRPAFNEMMDWVCKRDDFKLVLVWDVSRWGRFQDTDMSAYYKAICTRNNKQVIYTSIGFPREGEQLVEQFRETIDRYRSAETSRTLSRTVFDGAAKVAHQGYRPGASPPYAFYRLMLDENKKPDRILNPGQRKGIQNGRIILVPGKKEEVETVNLIFVMFVLLRFTEGQIADYLNTNSIKSAMGKRWTSSTVHRVLTNYQYAGCVVYNRTTQRLKSKTRTNPFEEWIITPNAYEPIVPVDLFERAQEIIAARKNLYDQEHILQQLGILYKKYNIVTSNLIRSHPACPAPSTVHSKLGGQTRAFQAIFDQIIQQVRNEVCQSIKQKADSVEEYDDFIVINRHFTVLVQPSVMIPNGYRGYWLFRPDNRSGVDITLGVPLLNNDDFEILGYVAFPKIMSHERCVRLSASSHGRIELQGYSGLDLIRELLQ